MVLLFGCIYGSKVVIIKEDTDVGGVGVGFSVTGGREE